MKLKEYFSHCEEKLPQSRKELRRICFALRRNGVVTMEELCLLRVQEPKKLAEFRDVGAKSLAVIYEICSKYEKEQKGEL